MIINDTTYQSLQSILIARVNADGCLKDDEVCKDIAAYLNMLPGQYHGPTLWEFISDYGEDIEEIYVGRDEDGEKIYHITNPKTNWYDRIRQELINLGYYQRHPAILAAKEMALAQD